MKLTEISYYLNDVKQQQANLYDRGEVQPLLTFRLGATHPQHSYIEKDLALFEIDGAKKVGAIKGDDIHYTENQFGDMTSLNGVLVKIAETASALAVGESAPNFSYGIFNQLTRLT